MTRRKLEPLLRDIRACTLCAPHLPQPPRPVLQAHPAARILIASQAPGKKAARSGIPFDDASGDRLRLWMDIDRDTFHDPALIAIVPMGFCFPGAGASGDLPPRPECAPAWRRQLLALLPNIRLALVIGQYALAWRLGRGPRVEVTPTVRAWRDHWPEILPLPHPSPRNNLWLRRNPWFDEEVIPALRERVRLLRAG
jgi:uracil-DNA glycosylase